ncbi:MAG: hypothetical protein BGO98_39430 [Myxococcales bacterium 68-20]|nr:MAG: hypothetical protein BGO98_39430 [Myxococcales bacterium 68-20]
MLRAEHSPSRLPPSSLPLAVALALAACAPSSRPEPAPPADANHDSGAHAPDAPAAKPAVDVSPAAASTADGGAPSSPVGATAPADDAGAASSAVSTATADPKVKVVTIGMHVAGGPYDEPTKEPFKKAVEPRFPELAQCWAKHVTTPPKQGDVGVDLVIEAAGGKPKVSNPRSSLDKRGSEGFVPCVVAIFEDVEFPKLVGRGRTGVSYSLRFTRR